MLWIFSSSCLHSLDFFRSFSTSFIRLSLAWVLSKCFVRLLLYFWQKIHTFLIENSSTILVAGPFNIHFILLQFFPSSSSDLCTMHSLHLLSGTFFNKSDGSGRGITSESQLQVSSTKKSCFSRPASAWVLVMSANTVLCSLTWLAGAFVACATAWKLEHSLHVHMYRILITIHHIKTQQWKIH